MAEMILPGTYIEVRAEGLMLPGPISIGNVGIVGTARRGRLADPSDPATVYTPANLGEARDIFGQYDAYDNPEESNNPLTLVRALELAYGNGAQRVFAVRVARTTGQGSGQTARYTLNADAGTTLGIAAVAPGSGYDRANLTTGPYSLGLGVRVSGASGVLLETLGNLPQDPALFAAQVNAASRLFLATNASGNAPIVVGAAVARTTDGADPAAARFALAAGVGRILFTARQPGTVMNGASITVAAGTAANDCTVTINSGTGIIETWNQVPRAPADFTTTLSGTNAVYDYTANASSTDAMANLSSGSALFTVADEGSTADVANLAAVTVTPGADAIAAVFSIPAGAGFVRLTARTAGAAANNWTVAVNGYLDVIFALGSIIETWREVPSNPVAFAQVINGTHPTYDYRTRASTSGRSSLFSVDATGATGNVAQSQSGVQTASGTNGAAAGVGDYQNGLAALLNQDVHIVVLAGQGTNVRAALVSHVETASGDLMKHERIAILGSDPSRQRTDLVAPSQDEGRLIFVGPGVRVNDAVANREVTLPGTYTAAAVAGLISSLDPHASPTNKTINVNSPETVFNGTELEQLVLGRVLALERRNGAIRIVRGITTSTNTAWAQITTRRIVDFARFGVRAAANPFIGKLNNERVRQALKGSINSFLADMVDREMLIDYQLDVSATREQQIRGIALVTMTLRPTFSIDYIRVVMYLQ
jgi:hypothetical protein